MTDPIPVRDGHAKLLVSRLQSDSGIAPLELADSIAESGQGRRIMRNNIQLRTVLFLLSLPYFNPRFRSAIYRQMRIACAGRSFPPPENVQLDVNPTDRVRNAGVAVIVEGLAGLPRNLPQFR